ncbi:MAG TPA: methionyl-tRNA formyltransferase [Oligoflexia bacterium]|nr:methionyl-tRNA formyltransferase [Oligoflexia bacterium]HMP48273.1 methionyl-tRNA formyltransferase [Oligoflexia bacterium]
MKPINILFLGTPDFAVPSLEALHNEPKINIQAVISQPDKPKDRGQNLSNPPVAKRASELNIPLFQPPSLRKISWKKNNKLETEQKENYYTDLVSFLAKSPIPDFVVVVAYGKLLPKDLLEYPKIDALNVHPSLLPRWRGAAPLQHTLLSGDKTTGVCIIGLEEELDAGPIYKRTELHIDEETDLKKLHDTLSNTGATLLKDTIIEITENNLKPVPQDLSGVTYARKWEKEDSIINWNESSINILNRIRASSPKPGARTYIDDKEFKILKARILSPITDTLDSEKLAPGTFIKSENGIAQIICGDNRAIEPLEVQLSGKKVLSFKDFLRGYSINSGYIF